MDLFAGKPIGTVNQFVSDNPHKEEARKQMIESLKANNITISEEDLLSALNQDDRLRVAYMGSARLDIGNLELPPPPQPSGPPTQVGARSAGRVRRFVDGYNRFLGRGNRNNRGIVVDAVPVGNNGIENKDDAIAYMARGQGGNLAEVPDVFLKDAIQGNPDRFRVLSEGDDIGVNGMARYLDRDTGRYLGIKFRVGDAAGFNEAYNEMAGNALAERLGFPVGQMRMDGPAADTPRQGNRLWLGNRNHPNANHQATPVVVVDLAQNPYGLEQGTLRDNMRTPPREGGGNLGSLSSRVRMTLLDMVIGNSDRHTGNYFLMRGDGARNFDLYPIDMGLGGAAGLYSPRDMRGVRDGGANIDDPNPEARMSRWINDRLLGGGRNNILGALRQQVNRSEQNRARTRREIEKALTQLRENHERLGSYDDEIRQIADIEGHAPVDRPQFDAAMGIVNENYEWLLSASADDVLDLLIS
jgi:hypothetical protein